MILSNVEEIVLGFTQSDDAHEWELDALRAHFMGLLTNEDDFRYTEDELKHMKRDRIVDELCERAMASYGEKEKLFGTETFREVERAILLRNVDTAWMEHIDIMDDLKGNVGLQAYAQRDPINEFRIQGANLFDDMVSDIRQKTVRTILSVVPREQPIRRVQVANPITAGLDSGEGRKKTVVKRASTTVVKDASATGRNDPCPCGSGKKYKNCCMRKNEG